MSDRLIDSAHYLFYIFDLLSIEREFNKFTKMYRPWQPVQSTKADPSRHILAVL